MFPTMDVFLNNIIWSVVIVFMVIFFILLIASKEWKKEKPKRLFGFYIVKRQRSNGMFYMSFELYERTRLGHLGWFSIGTWRSWGSWWALHRFTENEPFYIYTHQFDIDQMKDEFTVSSKYIMKPIDLLIQAITTRLDQEIMKDLKVQPLSLILLENWSVGMRLSNSYQAPEQGIPALQGNVYNHPRFEDGTFITTSRPVSLDEHVITRSGSIYTLGVIDYHYKCLYPNARERLLTSLR